MFQGTRSGGKKNNSISDTTSWGSIAIPRKPSATFFPNTVQHLPIGIRPSLAFPHESPLLQLPQRSTNLCGVSSLMRNLASPLMGTLKPVSCPVPPEENSTNASPSDLSSLAVHCFCPVFPLCSLLAPCLPWLSTASALSSLAVHCFCLLFPGCLLLEPCLP